MPVITNATAAAIRLVMPRTIRSGVATPVAAQPTAHRRRPSEAKRRASTEHAAVSEVSATEKLRLCSVASS